MGDPKVDTKIGTYNNRDVIVRQIGGQDDDVIEAGERVQVVARQASGSERVLTRAQAQEALGALGIRTSLTCGVRLNPLAQYAANLETIHRVSSEINELALSGRLTPAETQGRLGDLSVALESLADVQKTGLVKPDYERIGTEIASARQNVDGQSRSGEGVHRQLTQLLNRTEELREPSKRALPGEAVSTRDWW